MQFAAGKIVSAAASNTLVETELPTGLTIRGGFAWLIHFVEFTFAEIQAASTDQTLQFALSVRQGESAVPKITDSGTISRINLAILYQTSGVVIQSQTIRDPFLPPVIVANPKLSAYFATGTDEAGFRSKTFRFRIGYTTVPIDQRMYLEIAETWEVI